MTPRLSVRAAARERYGELKRKRVAPVANAPTPTPNPSPQEPAPGRAQARPGWGGEHAVHGGGEQTDLTARIRALYENSSVPVREIAGVAGVTERTLYRYVEKHGWTKRYHVMPRGREAAASNRGRRWRHAEGFAPAKGAGGRFIRREDIGKPFATGLKALDAQGRAKAHARCEGVEPLARKAQQEAASVGLTEQLLRALAELTSARDALARYRAERKRVEAYQAALAIARHNPSYKVPKKPALRFAASALTERALQTAERVAMAKLEAALARQERAAADLG